MDNRSKKLIIENISFFKEFAEKTNSYQLVKINVERIIYFLTQFKSYEEIKIMISLLKKLEFLNSAKITYLLKTAFNKINTELLEKPVLSTLGGIQDSSAVVCYQLLKNLFDDEKETLSSIININSLGEYIEVNNPSVIILFDDNITSGTQLNDFFEELLDGRPKPEFFSSPLTKNQYSNLQKIPIRICYAIQLAEGSNDVIEKLRLKYNLDLKFHAGKVDYNNYLDFQSDVMESELESVFAKKFISEISTELYEDKKWSRETVYSRVLGYGNLGKLTVFYYNVPKSLIPIFWKFGTVNGKPWIPLFPETQENKKLISSETTFDFMTTEAINSWLTSESSGRLPRLTFGISDGESLSTDIELEIPSKEFIDNIYLSKIKPKKIKYIDNKLLPRNNLAFLASSQESLKKPLDFEDYSRYKEQVDIYNEDLDKFCLELKDYIYKLSSTKQVNFILRNDGEKPATNFMIKLYYNTSEVTFTNSSDFCPRWSKKIPNINDFYTPKIGEIQIVHQPFLMPALFPVMKEVAHEPLQYNTNYECKISNTRLGHNDNFSKLINLTRFNVDSTMLEIPFELNHDDDSKTLDGKIIINYVDVEEINKDLEKKILNIISDNKDIINF